MSKAGAKDHERENILLSQKIQNSKKHLSDYALKSEAEARKLGAINTIRRQRESGTKNIMELLKIKHQEMGFAKYIPNRSNEITQLGLSAGYQNDKWGSWENMKWIVKPIFSYVGSPFVIVSGMDRLGVGKTDFSLELARLTKEKSVKDKVGSNITTDRFEFIESWDELLEFVDGSGSKLVIIDEARQFLDKLDSSTNEAKELSKEGDKLRKKSTHIILISKTAERLIGQFQSKITNCIIRKKSKKKALIDYENYGNKKLLNSDFPNPIKIQDIEPTSVQFDTNEVSKFNMDLDDSEESAIFECQDCGYKWKSKRYSKKEVEEGLRPSKCPSCQSRDYYQN